MLKAEGLLCSLISGIITVFSTFSDLLLVFTFDLLFCFRFNFFLFKIFLFLEAGCPVLLPAWSLSLSAVV